MEKTLRQKFNDGIERFGNKIYDGLGDVVTTDVSPKGLASLACAGVFGFGTLAGCATMGLKTFPEGHAHNYDFKTRNQSKEPYKLERVVLYGDQFYAQKTQENLTQKTLPFVIFPFNKVTREIDLDSNKITLKSKEGYSPKIVEVGTATEKKDNFADEIELKPTTSKKTGVKGIKANILCTQQLRERVGAFRNSYGFSGVTTEEDASFGIRTMKIFGERYFFPHVSDNKTDEKEKLPFYLIPIKGAKLKIKNSNGNISIRNENKIYRPIMIKNNGESLTVQESSGQAEIERY